MGELVDDPAVLRDRAEAVRGYLAAGGGRPPGELELRVGASVAQLGLAARLVSPAIGFAALYGGVLAVPLGELWWRPVLGGGFPLSLPERAVAAALEQPQAGPQAVADRLGEELLEGPLRALVGAVAGLSVSRLVLWGNVASAVNGAAAALEASAARPVAARGRALAAALLRQPALRGTSTLSSPDRSAGPDEPVGRGGALGGGGGGFRRLSCCLIYRAAPAGAGAGGALPLCGDCVLVGRR
jgi:hypothetical protein